MVYAYEHESKITFLSAEDRGTHYKGRVEAGVMSLPSEQRKVHNSSVTGLKDVKETANVCLCAEVLRNFSLNLALGLTAVHEVASGGTRPASSR